MFLNLPRHLFIHLSAIILPGSILLPSSQQKYSEGNNPWKEPASGLKLAVNDYELCSIRRPPARYRLLGIVLAVTLTYGLDGRLCLPTYPYEMYIYIHTAAS